MKIPFVSFEPMHREVDAELKNALLSVYEAGWFIRGERVHSLKRNLRHIVEQNIVLDVEMG